MSYKISQLYKLYHRLRGQDPRLKPSSRYAKGIASYGKKVRTDKRKARIIAELNAMGVKPRIRERLERTPREHEFKGFGFTVERGVVKVKPRFRYKLTFKWKRSTTPTGLRQNIPYYQ